MAARRGWLYRIPPVRGPRHTHHHGHHHHSDLGEAIYVAAWVLAGGLWCYEIMAWLTVWAYYGAFLGIRWSVRVGRAVAAARRAAPPRLPAGRPYVAPPEPEDARPW